MIDFIRSINEMHHEKERLVDIYENGLGICGKSIKTSEEYLEVIDKMDTSVYKDKIPHLLSVVDKNAIGIAPKAFYLSELIAIRRLYPREIHERIVALKKPGKIMLAQEMA